MTRVAPVEMLADYGPQASLRSPPSLAESREYCRRLARSHYENFVVASWLLPRDIVPHFQAVYAYCRWADDLADETGSTADSLELLDWWRDELLACYDGRRTHPVFVALGATIQTFDIPAQPFLDLLDAFRQDQVVTRYDTFDELLDYCRRSADPVGRLVLHLGRCCDEPRAALSDQVCTGLQLANFWQDVARDWEKGRVYLPTETRERFGCDERPWQERQATPEFRAALRFEVERAEQFLKAGLPLVDDTPAFLSADVWLFIQGGLRILRHIRRLDYDVWARRPKVGKLEQVGLMARCFLRRFTHRARRRA